MSIMYNDICIIHLLTFATEVFCRLVCTHILVAALHNPFRISRM